MRGYYTNEAILVGVESRTSSPVRIPRDKETYSTHKLAAYFLAEKEQVMQEGLFRQL